MNPPNMKCIGGPYRSTMREEMLALKRAADSLKAEGVVYKIIKKKIGVKGMTTIFHLWRSPDGVAKAVTQKDIGAGIVVHGMRGYHSGAFKSNNHRTP